jgi:hypothetical protein
LIVIGFKTFAIVRVEPQRLTVPENESLGTTAEIIAEDCKEV